MLARRHRRGCRSPAGRFRPAADPPFVPDLQRDQLQATLGASYTLAQELGGGGMSRVFVADEPRLGRQVVVKVLAPALAAGVSAERFAREIRLAAALRQANVVPLMSGR
jgi:serine/threonine protein kinase